MAKILISKDHIESLANRHLENTPLYLTGVRISADNHINVFIDGDRGVTIKDCVDLSRAIEGSLDRDSEDFSLDVSSHGATNPLVLPRQYKRHLGRELDIKLASGEKVSGTLANCGPESIEITYSVREDKPVGKGKVTVSRSVKVDFADIKEARIKLKYT